MIDYSPRRIAKIVSDVQQQSPLPETLDGVAASSRRRIEREAAAAGKTPADYYAELVAATLAQHDCEADAHDVAIRARRR